MTFKNAVMFCFYKYADFTGRASRKQFWFFTLFLVLVSIVLNIIDMIIFRDSFQFLTLLWFLATVTPHLAVGARRLHDIGQSGWLQLLWIIPCVGFIVMIVLYSMPTNVGENKYGAITI